MPRWRSSSARSLQPISFASHPTSRMLAGQFFEKLGEIAGKMGPVATAAPAAKPAQKKPAAKKPAAKRPAAKKAAAKKPAPKKAAAKKQAKKKR